MPMIKLKSYCEYISKELRGLAFYRDVVAQFLGTFVLVSAHIALILGYPPGPVMSTVGLGFTMVLVIEVFGPLGGVSFNPAVTVALVFGMEITIVRGVFYILAQVAGGIAGAALVFGLIPEANRGTLGATVLAPGVSPPIGMVVEIWITALLTLSIYGAINDRRRPVVIPSITIGLATVAASLIGNPFTGGSMNPARTLGPAIIMGIWTDHWVYWVGPIVGGILATLSYRYCLDLVGRRDKQKLRKELNESTLYVQNTMPAGPSMICPPSPVLPRYAPPGPCPPSPQLLHNADTCQYNMKPTQAVVELAPMHSSIEHLISGGVSAYSMGSMSPETPKVRRVPQDLGSVRTGSIYAPGYTIYPHWVGTRQYY